LGRREKGQEGKSASRKKKITTSGKALHHLGFESSPVRERKNEEGNYEEGKRSALRKGGKTSPVERDVKGTKTAELLRERAWEEVLREKKEKRPKIGPPTGTVQR